MSMRYESCFFFCLGPSALPNIFIPRAIILLLLIHTVLVAMQGYSNFGCVEPQILFSGALL